MYKLHASKEQLPFGMDKNFFSGLEIYFKGLEIYFSGSEIYFQSFEKVLLQAAKSLSAGSKGFECWQQRI